MKNHIKNYIKIMGLAAVPFGTAQAEDYEINVRDSDGLLIVTACCGKFKDVRAIGGGRERFCGEYRLFYQEISSYTDLYANRAMYSVTSSSVVRSACNKKGGVVAVADTKFSEGKSITSKDVERQWQQEEALFKNENKKWNKALTLSVPYATRVSCKMYELPEGCEVVHFVLLEERPIKCFLVKDPQRAFGGSEYTLVVVVPDDCETVTVFSGGIPTVTCGEVKDFVSSNEVLAPSVRARLLSVFGQKELSVNRCAAVCKSEMDKSEVLLKDCSFAQRAEAIIQVRYDFSDKGGFVGSVFRRLSLYGRFVFDPVMTRVASWGNNLVFFASKCAGWCQGRNGIEKEWFSKFFHRTSKRNAIRHIRNWADDIKDELLKVPGEERLEK